MILVGAVVYLQLNTEPTLNENVNDKILEEDIVDEEIIPELTVT